jgi:hypothetical protein
MKNYKNKKEEVQFPHKLIDHHDFLKTRTIFFLLETKI